MRGFIFLGLLACAHGLGDVYPFTNAQGHSFVSPQNANGWAQGSCATGTKQSPIDISSTTAQVPAEDPGALKATGFDGDRPVAWRVEGAAAAVPPGGGSTTSISFNIQSKIGGSPQLSGGPLTGSYAFSHAEFHWGGTTADLGSEHTIDGTRAAVEMQMVFHRQSFESAGETAAATWATTGGATLAAYGANPAQPANAHDLAVIAAASESPIDPAGIAVISYMIDVGAENAELKPITDSITTAGAAGAVATMVPWSSAGVVTGAPTAQTPAATANVNISTLMMLDQGALEDYYYYDGSLTLPADLAAAAATTTAATRSCAEIVRWILPTKRLTMSTAQINTFRSNANMAWMPATTVRNSRDVQTGARIAGITVNRRKPVTPAKDNAVWRNLAGTLLSVGTFGLVHNLLTQDDTAKALTENPVVDILQDIEQRFVRPAPQERQSFNHHHHPQDIQY